MVLSSLSVQNKLFWQALDSDERHHFYKSYCSQLFEFVEYIAYTYAFGGYVRGEIPDIDVMLDIFFSETCDEFLKEEDDDEV